MALFESKTPSYRTQEDIYRVQNYETYMDLFNGDHQRAFNNVSEGRLKYYIPVNLPRLIATVPADLLFGEAPKFITDDPETQSSIDRIVKANNLMTLLHESALTNAYKGDSLLKVRYGKRNYHSKDREVVIEAVKPDIYYPELDEAGSVISHNLAWLIQVDKQFILREEKHTPGIIYNNAYLSDENFSVKRQLNEVEMDMLFPGLEPEVETGVDEFLIIHIPNMRTGDSFFGQSDFKGMEALFDELNSRLSQISMILDKHANPKLTVPEGLVSNQGYVKQEDLELIEVTDGAAPPQYIVWDANLEAAFREVDKVIDLILTVSEISPSLLGMDKGGMAESGRALKFRLMNTLRKVAKKRIYYDQAIKELLLTVQKMENIHAGFNYPLMDIDIQWNDGIVNDEAEAIEKATLLFEKGLITHKKALQMIFPDLSEDAILALIEDTPVTPHSPVDPELPVDDLTVDEL